MICPRCGRENAGDVCFCGGCGLDLRDADVPAPKEERKVVSVVFVDLVGSTARAESSDPEDVRALLRIYHERTRDELESFGGTVSLRRAATWARDGARSDAPSSLLATWTTRRRSCRRWWAQRASLAGTG